MGHTWVTENVIDHVISFICFVCGFMSQSTGHVEMVS